MKKLFTLIAAAMMAASVNAQTTEQLYFSVDTYPWNYSVNIQTVDVTFTSQYGEYVLTNQELPLTEYSAVKITTTASATANGVNLRIDGDGFNQYNALPVDGGEMEVELKTTGTDSDGNEATNTKITKVELQSNVSTSSNANVTKVQLKKIDGTYEDVTAFTGGGWGYTLGPAATPITINFTGQYGGLQLIKADGSSVGLEVSDNTEYTIDIEFDGAAPAGAMVELDDADGGFNYTNITEPVESLSIKFDKSTLGKWGEDGSLTPKSATKIWRIGQIAG